MSVTPNRCSTEHTYCCILYELINAKRNNKTVNATKEQRRKSKAIIMELKKKRSKKANTLITERKTIQVIKNKWIIWTRAKKEYSSSKTSLCVVSFVQINFLLKQKVWKKEGKKPRQSKIHIILVCTWCTNMTICTHAEKKKIGKQRQPNTNTKHKCKRQKDKYTLDTVYVRPWAYARAYSTQLIRVKKKRKMNFCIFVFSLCKYKYTSTQLTKTKKLNFRNGRTSA